MCVVEKAGFEPRTLGTGAERATNCATAPVGTSEYSTKMGDYIVHFDSFLKLMPKLRRWIGTVVLMKGKRLQKERADERAKLKFV
jgi:hypothetical protein